MLGSLNHPNIAHVYDAGEHDLAGALPTEAGARPMTVVLNWQQAIGK